MKHMAVHGSEEAKPLQCMQCGKRFLNNSALACHIKVHSDENGNYGCPICGAPFNQIHMLKDHVHIHRSQEGTYSCPHCAKVFPQYSLIRKHIRSFHAEKRFHCEVCQKAFTGADKLKAHMVKHSERKDFVCDECGKRFKRKDKMREHVKRMHNEERKMRQMQLQKIGAQKLRGTQPNQKSSNQSEDLAVCHPPVGGGQGSIIQNITDGQQEPSMVNGDLTGGGDDFLTDLDQFTFKCHGCRLGFKRRGMLVNRLVKRHPGISVESVPELNQPILKETKNFYCQYCSKVYKSSSKRKVHIKKHHPGAQLPLSARESSKSGVETDSLDRSASISASVNLNWSETVGSVQIDPHKCRLCHKQYASNAKLLQHMRSKHPTGVEVARPEGGKEPSNPASAGE